MATLSKVPAAKRSDKSVRWFGDAIDKKTYYGFLKILCGIERIDHTMEIFKKMKSDGCKPRVPTYDLLIEDYDYVKKKITNLRSPPLLLPYYSEDKKDSGPSHKVKGKRVVREQDQQPTSIEVEELSTSTGVAGMWKKMIGSRMASCGNRNVKLRGRTSSKVRYWVVAINDAGLRPPKGWCHPHRFGFFAPPRGLTEDGSEAQWFVDVQAAIEEAKSEALPTLIQQRLIDNMCKYEVLMSHHEKLVIVDYRVDFIGGLDLCFGQYDTPSQSGTEQPSAYGELVSIGGLNLDTNKKLSAALPLYLRPSC
ncbi:hypothetical protein IFM89_008170 [Coptis chinensis]|uniref:phospholipase D n=1 Tax=Coptis chinensis TaxID=261450 RepID=A0A835MC59_9MAGN|nr:hypothetical protein IFM89_008170 [Coptis chinensis]